MVEGLLEVRPEDADLHLLLAMSLRASDPECDTLAAVRRAIDHGWDDASVLTRAASMCFYEADLATARSCVDHAKQIMPHGFPFKKELRELDRNLGRREKEFERHGRLSKSFNAEPHDRRVAAGLARLLAGTGREYTAYFVVARGLHHHPEDRSLRRLQRKLRKAVPEDVRAEAEEWAVSGEPTTNLSWRPVGGSGPADANTAHRPRQETSRPTRTCGDGDGIAPGADA